MQTIIWAFGSMIVLIGIISFLPIGLTIKGKIVVGFASFVLSFGGFAATSTFPLWSTYLMLLVITFFTAYIIDSRMKKILYTEKIPVDDENFQDVDLSFSSRKKERREVILTENELTEIKSDKEIDIVKKDSLIEISGSELENSVEKETLKVLAPIGSELLIQDDAKLEEIYFTKNEGILDELSEVNDIQEIVELSSIPETNKEDWLEELAVPELSGEQETYKGLEFINSDLEEGYLAEIESLLDEHQNDEVAELPTIESEKISNIAEESWINELWKAEVVANDEKNESENLEIEHGIEDSELEILLAAKEAAASVEVREPEKKLAVLQK